MNFLKRLFGFGRTPKSTPYRDLATNWEERRADPETPALLEALTTPKGLHAAISQGGVVNTAKLLDKSITNLTTALNLVAELQYDYVTAIQTWFKNQQELSNLNARLKKTTGPTHGKLQEKKTELMIEIEKNAVIWRTKMEALNSLCAPMWSKEGKEFNTREEKIDPRNN